MSIVLNLNPIKSQLSELENLGRELSFLEEKSLSAFRKISALKIEKTKDKAPAIKDWEKEERGYRDQIRKIEESLLPLFWAIDKKIKEEYPHPEQVNSVWKEAMAYLSQTENFSPSLFMKATDPLLFSICQLESPSQERSLKAGEQKLSASQPENPPILALMKAGSLRGACNLPLSGAL